MTAVFVRAMQPDIFDCYKPRSIAAPLGWAEDYIELERLSGESKAAGWRALQTKYAKFIQARSEIKAANDSDEHFLNEMLSHFEKLGMLPYVHAIKSRLKDFEFAKRVV